MMTTSWKTLSGMFEGRAAGELGDCALGGVFFSGLEKTFESVFEYMVVGVENLAMKYHVNEHCQKQHGAYELYPVESIHTARWESIFFHSNPPDQLTTTKGLGVNRVP